MSTSPWLYFTLDELKCKCGQCGSTGLEMKDDFMQWIVKLRVVVNIPLHVSSAYRCPQYNAKVSSTGLTGPHTTGKAMDILCSNERAMQIIDQAFSQKVTGFASKQTGNGRFVHLDILTPADGFVRPNTWGYP